MPASCVGSSCSGKTGAPAALRVPHVAQESLTHAVVSTGCEEQHVYTVKEPMSMASVAFA